MRFPREFRLLFSSALFDKINRRIYTKAGGKFHSIVILSAPVPIYIDIMKSLSGKSRQAEGGMYCLEKKDLY